MTITQEPATSGMYFQNSIPDIILKKTDLNNSVAFTLKKGTEIILNEQYVYDSEGLIQIKNIGDLVKNYFVSNPVVSLGSMVAISDGLCLGFTFLIKEGTTTHENSFIALKCDADISVDAASWTFTNFLTRSYLEKRTAKGRNEYLSFYQKSSYQEITIHYKLFYTLNGTNIEKTGSLGLLPQSSDTHVFTFNTSIGRIITDAGLPLDTDTLQYDIWLTGTDLITDVYTYMVDNMLYRDHSSFVYINCFGVMETFTATGKTINKKTNDYNLSNINGYSRKITQIFISEKTCNSGYLSESEMEWIDDLVNSYIVGLSTSSEGLSEEITLVSIEKSDSDLNELHTFLFEYRRAKNNHLMFSSAATGLFDDTFDETFN